MTDHRSVKTGLYAAWETDDRPKFRTGVSLHGHTWLSKESLAFLPGAIQKTYVLPYLMRILERRYRTKWNREIDYSLGYWTSPVSPESAYDLESAQIEAHGLKPLVSITDHDEIAACKNIVSLEWTAPYKESVFHVGLHNISPGHAPELLKRLHHITASSDTKAMSEILVEIAAMPDALIVLNHPLVDQGRIGQAMHLPLVKEFIEKHSSLIHALEINALQPQVINEEVTMLGEVFSLPLIAGGDRHSFEPNGAINLTNAKTFPEFVHEIRDEKESAIFFMPQYRENLTLRYTKSAEMIMAYYPELGDRAHWNDRVFYECPDGIVRSITEIAGQHSKMVRTTDRIVEAMGLINLLTDPLPSPFSEKKDLL